MLSLTNSNADLLRIRVEKERRRRAAERAQVLAVDLADPATWIESYFWIPERGGPITLAPYQRACLREALRRDEAGNFAYSTILWGDIKKSAKSTIAAAVVAWMMESTKWGSGKVIANDLKQADSRVAYYLRRAVELNPAWRERIRVKPSGYLVEWPNRARCEAVPIDPKGEAGGNDDIIVFSELWGAQQQAAQRMWTEMTLSPTKFGKSFRWVETYAGFDGESDTLWRLYEQGVREGMRLDLSIPGLEVYANPAARLFALWNTTPRLEWQTSEYYAQEAAALLSNEFRRVHGNEWVSSEDAYVQPEWWDACRSALPPLPPGAPVVIAVDAGVSSDCFGMVLVSRTPDRHVHARYARKWQPKPGHKLDFSEPEGELRRLVAAYNVVEVAYDEYQLHDMMTRLRNEGIAHFRPFAQGQERAKADKALRDMIVARTVHHDGQADLSEHVKNANAKTEGDKTLRLVKRAETKKIDLAVCLSMAAAEILRLNT